MLCSYELRLLAKLLLLWFPCGEVGAFSKGNRIMTVNKLPSATSTVLISLLNQKIRTVGARFRSKQPKLPMSLLICCVRTPKRSTNPRRHFVTYPNLFLQVLVSNGDLHWKKWKIFKKLLFFTPLITAYMHIKSLGSSYFLLVTLGWDNRYRLRSHLLSCSISGFVLANLQ